MNTAHAREWSSRLAQLLGSERNAMVEFILSLAEFDRLRLWVELGYDSLFSYLHRELGMSKGASYYRKTAVVLVQRFPALVEPLRDGRICITVLPDLAKVLTESNFDEVLPRFFSLSRDEAKVVTAELAPEVAPRREVVTTVESVSLGSTSPRVVQRGELSTRREEARPVNATEHRLHLTVDKDLLAALEEARTALSHKMPGASLADVIREGTRLVLKEHEKRKALTDKPRPARSMKSERIPAHVKRDVWKRDAGRCVWPLESGGTCDSTFQLELDHVVPKAQGGPAAIDNLRVLCLRHNQIHAQRTFGTEFMLQYMYSSAG